MAAIIDDSSVDVARCSCSRAVPTPVMENGRADAARALGERGRRDARHERALLAGADAALLLERTTVATSVVDRSPR